MTPCPFAAWPLLPLELRRRLRALPTYLLLTERRAHLADHPRCPCIQGET